MVSGAVVCVDRALYGLHPKLGNELMEYLAAHVVGVAPVPLSGNEKLCFVPSGLSMGLVVRDTLLLRGLDKQTQGLQITSKCWRDIWGSPCLVHPC